MTFVTWTYNRMGYTYIITNKEFKMNKIAREKSHAFGKDVYLLGRYKTGEFLWLESPSWDCEWYWGFGYVETYTHNSRPDLSRDITSHSHFSSLCNISDKNTGEYIHHINENPDFESTVLDNSDSWKLASLMNDFYNFRKVAEALHRSKDKTEQEFEKWLNEVKIPEIMDGAIKLLTPTEK